MAERERTSLRPEAAAGSGKASNGDSRNLPATTDKDLRRHLPGVEPERRLDDWGRSERVEGAMDKLLYDFMYRYWFRCEVEGIENVPASGGAMLVSNHSGTLPLDGAMLKVAVLKEHGRNPWLLAADLVFRFPGLREITQAAGNARADREETLDLQHRGELVGVFPEG